MLDPNWLLYALVFLNVALLFALTAIFCHVAATRREYQLATRRRQQADELLNKSYQRLHEADVQALRNKLNCPTCTPR